MAFVNDEPPFSSIEREKDGVQLSARLRSVADTRVPGTGFKMRWDFTADGQPIGSIEASGSDLPVYVESALFAAWSSKRDSTN